MPWVTTPPERRRLTETWRLGWRAIRCALRGHDWDAPDEATGDGWRFCWECGREQEWRAQER